MLKIAHIVATFPPHIGGMGGVVFDEVNALAKAGHDVTVFTLAYPGHDYLQQNSQNPLHCPPPNRGRSQLLSPLKGERYREWYCVVRLHPLIRSGDAGWVPQLFFRLKGFDIVHLHYPWYGGAEWVLLAAKLRGQKYVVTYHMQAAPTSLFKKIVKFKYDWFLTKAILRGAAKVLVVDKSLSFRPTPHLRGSGGISPTTTRSLDYARDDNQGRAIEFPNPVDTNLFQPRAVTATDVGLPEFEHKKIILFVGNLMPVKRLDLAIEALLKLPAEVVLLVVGGGYEEARYKKMVSDKNVSARVKFIGRIEEKQKLAAYYSVATVTVVPSDAESFSLVTLESLAAGTPVVASDIPGIRARVSDGQDGFLFTPGSVASLAEKLNKILSLSLEERKQMGERGRAKVVEKYGIVQHIIKLQEIYKSVF